MAEHITPEDLEVGDLFYDPRHLIHPVTTHALREVTSTRRCNGAYSYVVLGFLTPGTSLRGNADLRIDAEHHLVRVRPLESDEAIAALVGLGNHEGLVVFRLDGMFYA